MTRASAPGKLFLFGEYAVLCGGWALVAATDRFVHVDLDPTRSSYEVEGAPLAADTRLPRAAMRALGLPESRVDHLRADLAALYERGEKLGLGSSAASTIASMLAAKPELAAQPMHLFDRAFAAHREIQQGKGSGADVASAALGGLIAYRLKVPQEPLPAIDTWPDVSAFVTPEEREHAQIVRGLKLPDALRIEAIWTGKPASSTSLIAQLEAALHQKGEIIEACLSSMTRHAATVMLTLLDAQLAMPEDRFDEDERVARIVKAANLSHGIMERLTKETGAPIVTPTHRALWSMAKTHQIVAKVSGAGGGDFSLLFGHERADWSAVLTSLPKGCVHIPLELGTSAPAVHHL